MQLSLLRGYDAARLEAMSEDEAWHLFCKLRWWYNAGNPECPKCHELAPYPCSVKERHKKKPRQKPPRRIFICRNCQHHFSPTSSTPFASTHLTYRELLILTHALMLRGDKSVLAVSRSFKYDYKVLWILNKKIQCALDGRSTDEFIGRWQKRKKVKA